MLREKFLTIRWNNLLSFGLGIPALLFVIGALSDSLWTERNGFIWLALIGAFY